MKIDQEGARARPVRRPAVPDDRQTRPPTILDGLSLKMLLLSGTDDGEASWPRTQFLFEHEGGDIRPTR